MGAVYRKTFTKPLPAGAEMFTRKGERFARWKDNQGKTRTAPLTAGRDGSERIVVKAGTYTAKYRDGSGIVQEKATGCRDETAAKSVLAELERRAELVKANVLTAADDSIADHQDTPLVEHFDAYVDHQNVKGLSRVRIGNTGSRLERLAGECGFGRLADLDGSKLERWLAERKAEGMSAGTRNEYRQELVGFGNWCVRTRRLSGNPFGGVPKADARADCRRKRRALTEGELVRLLDATSRRPLLDAMTVRRGKQRGEAVAQLREGVHRRLERLGQERALIYKTMVLTGLRKAELASLTVGQLELDGSVAYVVLDAADEKNRQGSEIPLRADLADDLRSWLADKLEAVRSEARGHDGQTVSIAGVPSKLPADAPLFNVPAGLVRILDRDLKLAGIPKVDERGRTVDVHALRHTFGTHLSKGGAAPRTAQAAMRHSTIDLTMNVYTDPKLLDVHGALDVLRRKFACTTACTKI
jgi:integrase